MKFEFEYYLYDSDKPRLEILDLASNTEAETVAETWLKSTRTKLRQELNPRTKQDFTYLRSLVAKLHVSMGRPIDRTNFYEYTED